MQSKFLVAELARTLFKGIWVGSVSNLNRRPSCSTYEPAGLVARLHGSMIFIFELDLI